jgi:hypothetical protein
VGIAMVIEPGDGSPPAPRNEVANAGEVSPVGPDRLGWPPAFVELYRSRYLPMVRLAFLLLGSNAVAEEVVQEAFVRVRNAVDRVDNPAAYLSLRVAVVNACRNEQRHANVERRHRPAIVPLASLDQPDHLADALSKTPRSSAVGAGPALLRGIDGGRDRGGPGLPARHRQVGHLSGPGAVAKGDRAVTRESISSLGLHSA